MRLSSSREIQRNSKISVNKQSSHLHIKHSAQDNTGKSFLV